MLNKLRIYDTIANQPILLMLNKFLFSCLCIAFKVMNYMISLSKYQKHTDTPLIV